MLIGKHKSHKVMIMTLITPIMHICLAAHLPISPSLTCSSTSYSYTMVSALALIVVGIVAVGGKASTCSNTIP